MSVASLEWSGLAELKAALKALPETIAREAAEIVEAHANDAARTVQANYPIAPTTKSHRGGKLRGGVTVEINRSRFGAAARVRSRAHHSHLFERGTKRRNYHGADRGEMPEASPAQQMIPAVIRARKRMVAALIALVRRNGFEVSE